MSSGSEAAKVKGEADESKNSHALKPPPPKMPKVEIAPKEEMATPKALPPNSSPKELAHRG